MMGLSGEMMKLATSKSLLIKINLAFLALFLLVYITLIRPPSLYNEYATTLIPCSLRDCHINKVAKQSIPSFFTGLHKDSRIGLVNMEEDEALGWETVKVEFERASANLEWKDLFPEWIDEEEEYEGPSCPEVPMPDFSAYEEVDVVVARAPCRRPEAGWARDVERLQVHLVVAEMAVRRGRRDGRGKVKVAVASKCPPMMEIFRCDDLVGRDGEWWMYEVEAGWLADKAGLPVGSCRLALPLWHEGTNKEYNHSDLITPAPASRREAYATVLHSSEMYVCGAIALAQSILKAGTTRDLLLLHDASIPAPKLAALVAAGWNLRLIKRIRNPRAEKASYNEYNYSKLRLWQLTDYRKVVFIDSDIVVLRSLDLLFRFPQMSAVGNDGIIFNSGVMVIEPSNCTFRYLMGRRKDVVSYNGGDQGFLNEVFVWWHRLPRRVNFLKNFWSNMSAEVIIKNSLYGADPPELYSIHYLGLKPWLCYRDYDCNFDVEDQVVFASDVAHWRWWRLHDEMDKGLWGFCGLSPERKEQLAWDRKMAKKMGIGFGHWRMNISDMRQKE